VARAADANDRRSRLAVLTDAGRSAYEKGRRIQLDAEEALFGALTAEESATLHTLLSKLNG